MTVPDPDDAAPPAGDRSLRWLVVLLVSIGLLGLALVAFGGGKGGQPENAGMEDVGGQGADIGGPFTLIAPDGSPFPSTKLAGKPFAIFFGFTRCPDVCPTSLARMARLRKQLGADGGRFEIVFVSVDPGHDTPADVGRYAAMFGSPIHGLTGTGAQLAAIEKAYGVYVQKVPQPGGDYTIDHTAAIYLMDAAGRFADTINFQEPEAESLAKLKRLVERS